MSFLSSPHARQLVLVTLPILLRYPLSGKWVSLSCVITLAAVLESLGLLIDFRNLLDGFDSSIIAVTFTCFEFLHSSCHSFMRLLLCTFFTVDGLISMGF